MMDSSPAVKSEIIAAALDCPGAWAIAAQQRPRPIVLGRFTMETLAPPTVGRSYVVMGWTLGTEGRRRYAGTAVIDEHGQVRAVAKATWIVVKRLSEASRPREL